MLSACVYEFSPHGHKYGSPDCHCRRDFWWIKDRLVEESGFELAFELPTGPMLLNRHAKVKLALIGPEPRPRADF